ncbi:rod shape-determining protein MreC [Noviherbaspirillum cavernae]|uniref:Cell shape-determining protein MreC n=1 Tax=Noviherbaspirillum cavernae TaxID=2320862 RepID=A0A418WXM5_9BURK|nr:rod shape-determining protein MreC [Noviherbaspirillum cavernae]RJG04845.1 rod shape-determining protein MreC [Noviherbaspirillum cavernae]
MEYSPPPLFKQGASARAKVVIFALIAIGLLLADAHLRSLGMIRQFVGTALYPLQVVALLPRDAAYMVGDYFSSLSAMQRENRALTQEKVANAQVLQQAQQLSAENAQLRKLLAANERVPVKSVLSEILYDARDAFTRKIVLDRGSKHGVAPGQPVIDDVGVVGQVTRVFTFTSEVTLLTDKDQAIPVQVVRSGLRSIVYGQGHSGSLDLRFMPVNADIQTGDVLVTSGIDGVYPAGLSVAKVVQVERKSSDAFARIVCQPLAGIDRNRQLLILLTESNFPARPAPEEAAKKDRAGKKAVAAMKDGGKEAPAETPKDAPKDAAKDPAREVPKEAPKETVKAAAKEPAKEAVKEPVKPVSTAASPTANAAKDKTAAAPKPAAPATPATSAAVKEVPTP